MNNSFDAVDLAEKLGLDGTAYMHKQWAAICVMAPEIEARLSFALAELEKNSSLLMKPCSEETVIGHYQGRT